jgi:hypothetical protein
MSDRPLYDPIRRRDIKGPAMYAPIRDDFRRRIIELKQPRRVIVGDRVSLVFENRHTLIGQIEEMCRAENLVRDDQIEAEIAVYNELMPTAASLSATLFVELPHDVAHAIRAAFEPGRSTADRISAVQYMRFPLTDAARAALATPGTELAVEIDHPKYRHRTACGEPTRVSLAADYA